MSVIVANGLTHWFGHEHALDSVDLVVLSQALHHAEKPAEAIAAARRILKPGGQLMVLDLLKHKFEQAHELYGDRWLAF